MTDYKTLRLIATSSPHIRSDQNTQDIMFDVIVALLPALLMGILNFGPRAASLTGFSVAACVFLEWAYRALMRKPASIGDLSAVVTGMLLAFVCPVTTPYWMILIGDAFAILLVKQLFGGIGCNFVNPALAGRAALLASYAGVMTSWADPSLRHAAMLGKIDVITTATPLSLMSWSRTLSLKKKLITLSRLAKSF